MGAILDIILSLVIRGAIAVAIMNMTIALQGKLSEKTAQANMFNLVNTVGRVLSNDMKKVGYRASADYFNPNPVSPDSIEFKCDTTTNVLSVPAVCWIKYSAGNTSELSSTPNPNDRKLYRTVKVISSGAVSRSLLATGLVTLRCAYYDKDGKVTTDVTKIKSFSVYLVMATGEQVNGFYPAGEWTYRFFPSNIN